MEPAWRQARWPVRGFSVRLSGLLAVRHHRSPISMTERNHKLNSFGKKNKFYNKLGGVISKDFPKFNYMNLERNMSQERNYLGMTPLTKIY